MIITSLLDTDQYIFTMCQAVLRKYPNAIAKFKFKCRNMKLRFSNQQLELFNDELNSLCSLRFQNNESVFLKSIRYFEPFFIEYLRLLQLNRTYVNFYRNVDGVLEIEIEGPLSSIIWFEVPILRIVSCIYHRNDVSLWDEGMKRLQQKIQYVKDKINPNALHMFSLIDFGTRRAYSPQWHEDVIIELKENASEFFKGTSNLLYAMHYHLKPFGTMSHLWIQAHQQFGSRLVDSQKEAFKAWSDVYQGDLGIALSDTLGFDKFLHDFNPYFSKLFDGARHDSGDPYDWGERLINHYDSFGISPLTKTAIFSDGLTFPDAVKLFQRFHLDIKTSFGIGTNLTNDLGPTPLQIVIKMIYCSLGNSEPMGPVAKISDSPGKGMCEDVEFLSYLKRVIQNGG